MFLFNQNISVTTSEVHVDKPVFVLDDSIHDFLHLLGKGRGVGGQLLGRGSPPLPLPLPVLVFVDSPAPPRRGRGTGQVQVAVPFPLTRRLFVTHLLLDFLQSALLYCLADSRRHCGYFTTFDHFSPPKEILGL